MLLQSAVSVLEMGTSIAPFHFPDCSLSRDQGSEAVNAKQHLTVT